MRRLALLAIFAAVVPMGAACAASIDTYRYWRAVERPDAQSEEIVSIALDRDIYAATQASLADLRITDSDGTEVPYKLEKEVETRGTTIREPCGSRVVSLKELDGGRLEIVVALRENAPAASGLVVRTPLKDFERRVEVFGRAVGADWRPLVADGVIFDYSRYMDISNRDIALPENADREYRLVIDTLSDEQKSPLTELTRHMAAGAELNRTERTTVRERSTRIDGVDLYHSAVREETGKEVQVDYAVAGFEAEQNAKDKQTILRIRTDRQPLNGLSIASATPNFVRHAVVQVPLERAGLTEWRDVGHATLSAIHFHGFERERLSILFPEQRHAEFRVIINNEDNPPLAVTGVVGKGEVYRLTFFAAPGATHRLYYGSATAERPQYDTAALVASLAGRYKSQAATLGPAAENPQYRPTTHRRAFGNGWLFAIAIGLLVVVLAAILYGAVRRVDRLPPEE